MTINEYCIIQSSHCLINRQSATAGLMNAKTAEDKNHLNELLGCPGFELNFFPTE